MSEKVSLIFANSSSEALANFVSLLKSQIESAQRPFIACLSYNQLEDSLKNGNLENFMREFIAEKLNRMREAVEQSQQMNEFNQLALWREMEADEGKKSKRKSSRIKKEWKSQLCMLRRDTSRRIILDFPPPENEVELSLVLFDVYDVAVIKTIASLSQTSSFKVIVNFHERNESDGHILQHESFWHELLLAKNSIDFENFAFIDMSVPHNSNFMLNLRSQLFFEQFSHFIYDTECIKAQHKSFCEHSKVQEIEIDNANEDLIELKNRMNEIPNCMQTVECIYDQIIQHICNILPVSSASSTKANKFQIEAYDKRIYDMSDKWAHGSDENPNFYSAEIAKLELLLSYIWQSVPTISMEKSQVLNYFLKKVARCLRCHEKGKFFFSI
jgi:hypothetical protein